MGVKTDKRNYLIKKADVNIGLFIILFSFCRMA
ncbi:hypothetical protein LTSEINV_4050, partial [Salmonella enterica subsp. enterica serovar Inverness str. R8-3668]